jgi:hypothetical protein
MSDQAEGLREMMRGRDKPRTLTDAQKAKLWSEVSEGLRVLIERGLIPADIDRPAGDDIGLNVVAMDADEVRDAIDGAYRRGLCDAHQMMTQAETLELTREVKS